jgi:hypothetical protein
MLMLVLIMVQAVYYYAVVERQGVIPQKAWLHATPWRVRRQWPKPSYVLRPFTSSANDGASCWESPPCS